MYCEEVHFLPGRSRPCGIQTSEASASGSSSPKEPQSASKRRPIQYSIKMLFTVTVWKKDASPYLQSQWQEWTRCKDWKTGSWPQQCGRPLHGWAWRCCWTACPNCSKNRQKAPVSGRNVKLNNNFVFNESSLRLLTSWVSGHLPQIQRAIRGEGAMRRPPPQQCGLWR